MHSLWRDATHVDTRVFGPLRSMDHLDPSSRTEWEEILRIQFKAKKPHHLKSCKSLICLSSSQTADSDISGNLEQLSATSWIRCYQVEGQQWMSDAGTRSVTQMQADGFKEMRQQQVYCDSSTWNLQVLPKSQNIKVNIKHLHATSDQIPSRSKNPAKGQDRITR